MIFDWACAGAWIIGIWLVRLYHLAYCLRNGYLRLVLSIVHSTRAFSDLDSECFLTGAYPQQFYVHANAAYRDTVNLVDFDDHLRGNERR